MNGKAYINKIKSTFNIIRAPETPNTSEDLEENKEPPAQTQTSLEKANHDKKPIPSTSRSIKNQIMKSPKKTRLKDQRSPIRPPTSTHSSPNKKPLKEKQKSEYNKSFTLSEAIQKSHNTTVSPDDVHYEFLRHLPPKFLNYLLSAFNEICQNGTFPESWKMATIIPVPKSGKNNLHTSNYCPLALTSCQCKTMERMVNRRLVWFIESNNLFTNFQCDFRSQRSTMDHVVR